MAFVEEVLLKANSLSHHGELITENEEELTPPLENLVVLNKQSLYQTSLEVGQDARVAPLQRGKSWQTGTLVKQLSDKSYLVKTGTGTIRRNRQFLKPQEPPASKFVLESVPNVPEPVRVPEPVQVPKPAQVQEPVQVREPVKVREPIKQMRTRIIKPPKL